MGKRSKLNLVWAGYDGIQRLKKIKREPGPRTILCIIGMTSQENLHYGHFGVISKISQPMILEYKPTLQQYRKYLFRPLVKVLLAIVVAIVVGMYWFKVTGEDTLGVVGITLVWSLIVHVFPLVFIGIRHIQHFKDAYLAIDWESNRCRYREKDKELHFNLADVERVIKVVSPPKYDDRIDIVGFGNFFYWKIIFRSGECLFISCMVLDVNRFLQKKQILEKKMFPIPPSNKHLLNFHRL